MYLIDSKLWQGPAPTWTSLGFCFSTGSSCLLPALTQQMFLEYLLSLPGLARCCQGWCRAIQEGLGHGPASGVQESWKRLPSNNSTSRGANAQEGDRMHVSFEWDRYSQASLRISHSREPRAQVKETTHMLVTRFENIVSADKVRRADRILIWETLRASLRDF